MTPTVHVHEIDLYSWSVSISSSRDTWSNGSVFKNSPWSSYVETIVVGSGIDWSIAFFQQSLWRFITSSIVVSLKCSSFGPYEWYGGSVSPS